MTICALLLRRAFFSREPSVRLKYAALGLPFVNVSIGGTLTHFAASPVLMVARVWKWDTPHMLSHFGWRAVVGILLATGIYFLAFRRELTSLVDRAAIREEEEADEDASDQAGRGAGAPSCAAVGDPGPRALHRMDRRECALSGAVPRRGGWCFGCCEAGRANRSRHCALTCSGTMLMHGPSRRRRAGWRRVVRIADSRWWRLRTIAVSRQEHDRQPRGGAGALSDIAYPGRRAGTDPGVGLDRAEPVLLGDREGRVADLRSQVESGDVPLIEVNAAIQA